MGSTERNKTMNTPEKEIRMTLGARMYDGRLGRWWSVDPLQAKAPWSSCYSYCEDSPIEFFDPDGKKKRRFIIINNHITNTTTKIQLPSSNDLKYRAFEVRQEPFGIRSDCWHTEYEWYDFTQSLIFDVYDDHVELSVSEDTDDYPRTTTTYEWEWWAKTKISELDKVWGGICWTTTGYVGPGNEKDKSGSVDTPYENIDDLMSMFDLAFKNRGIGNEFNIPGNFTAESKLLEALDAIQSRVSKQSEKIDVFTGLLLKLKDSLPNQELRYYHCTICNKVYDSNQHEVAENEINTMGLSRDKMPQISPSSEEHGD
ncbi:MAG TPA: hypothetical protein DCF44_05225 [Chitinophagaceae bacterium]|nr:hypothetical protein [Chitinophagaceae bacterium]